MIPAAERTVLLAVAISVMPLLVADLGGAFLCPGGCACTPRP